MSDASDSLKLKLKLPRSLAASGATMTAAESEEQRKKREEALRIGARGGAAVKELLSTAPNIEVAIREFQDAHGVAEAHAQLGAHKTRRAEVDKGSKAMSFTPAVQLLDLLRVRRSSMYQALLEQMRREMLLRIAELPQSELQRVLEQTFPYIEFRELRAIPIAVLARQEDTSELYLRELTENRRILAELPVHVRRKILQVDHQELQLFVEECTREYVTGQLEWYLKHSTAKSSSSHAAGSLSRRSSNGDMRGHNRKRSLDEAAGGSLWNVSSHVPTSTGSSGPSSAMARRSAGGERRPLYSPEDRRHHNPALAKLAEMLGDSESLYLSTLDIWKGYVVSANIPGACTNGNQKEYVDYVPLLGAMRSDLANLQRDKTTALLRTDPLHKFIWFLDRALKNQTLQIVQLHELLGFIGRLRTGDLPANKKFRKKSGGGPAEENFEVVLGPPPVSELLSVLDKLERLDVRLIFAEPVPDDVPKYRDIIKEPMDLSTMRKKAKRGKYKSLEAFVVDFNLMIRNCMTFNPDTTIFYKEGKRVGKRGNELIEKHATALRGEPQRIRSKKRRKNAGPSNEAVNMLTSSGITTLKDFGDVDQSGMVAEGMCEEMLADVALILSDPHVKQLLCDALMKNLVTCWQKKELPTDNVICRALVQLLQVGNPSSVRRMIRKKDFVLRAPQVVTMRVVLPLLLRAMTGFRVYFGFPSHLQCDVKKAKEDVLSAMLWDNVLRASSAIRTMAKSFAVQCLVDHQIEAGAILLRHLLVAEDELLLRDRVLLHALTEGVLEQVKTVVNSNSSGAGVGGGDEDDADDAENGEVTLTLSDQVRASAVWMHIVDGFFMDTLEQRTKAIKDATGSVVVLDDGGEPVAGDEDDSTTTASRSKLKKRKRPQVVQSFALPVFHEKAAMMLASAFALVEKGDPAAVGESTVAPCLKKTLGVLRACCSSLDEFVLLWDSVVFAGCREFYDPLLVKCPRFQEGLFAPAPATSKTPAAKTVKIESGDDGADAIEAGAESAIGTNGNDAPGVNIKNEPEAVSTAGAESDIKASGTSSIIKVEEESAGKATGSDDQVKNEDKSDPRPKSVAGVGAMVESNGKSSADASAKADTRSSVNVESHADIEPHTGAGSKTEVKAESKSEVVSQSEAESTVELKRKSETEGESKVGAEADGKAATSGAHSDAGATVNGAAVAHEDTNGGAHDATTPTKDSEAGKALNGNHESAVANEDAEA